MITAAHIAVVDLAAALLIPITQTIAVAALLLHMARHLQAPILHRLAATHTQPRRPLWATLRHLPLQVTPLALRLRPWDTIRRLPTPHRVTKPLLLRLEPPHPLVPQCQKLAPPETLVECVLK